MSNLNLPPFFLANYRQLPIHLNYLDSNRSKYSLKKFIWAFISVFTLPKLCHL